VDRVARARVLGVALRHLLAGCPASPRASPQRGRRQATQEWAGLQQDALRGAGALIEGAARVGASCRRAPPTPPAPAARAATQPLLQVHNAGLCSLHTHLSATAGAPLLPCC
jgi:hypothetical protein